VNDDMDARLAEVGRRWRDAQPAAPEPDVPRFAGGVRAVRRRAPVAALAAAVVAAILLVPLAASRIGAPSTGGPNTWPSTGRSVPVEGFGLLFRDGDGPIRLCAGIGVTEDVPPPSRAFCGPVAVVTTGVDERILTESTERGQRYSGHLRVEGTYHAGTLAVSRVAPSLPENGPSETPAAVPCAPPENGWRPGMGLPLSGHELELAKAGFVERVRSEPERFVEPWNGRPTTAPGVPSSSVQVVGTTGDVAAAQAELAAIYAGNLCVHPVRFSASDLNRIVERLSAVSSTPIQAEASPILDRVRVRVVALDPPTNAILDEVGRDALILEEPLLRWLE
jgi:hypothetical protein